YTASGRDNAAQLFSGRHLDHENAEVAALARLSIDERVDAAQLELGIPLRWKGPLRDAFVEGLVAAMSRGDASPQASAEAGVQDDHDAGHPVVAVPRTAGGW